MNLFKGFSILLLLLMTQISHARDMSGRLGLGFVNQFSSGAPSLALKYGLTKDMAVQGSAGFDTSLPTAANFGGKVFKNLFYESNMNFYAAFGLAYVKAQSTGVEILSLVGAEFFIPGIESLGLSFETGISVCNVTGTFGVKTVGFSFWQAGTHFYF